MNFLKFAETSKNGVRLVSFAPEGREHFWVFGPIPKSTHPPPCFYMVGEQGGKLRPNTTDGLCRVFFDPAPVSVMLE